MNPGALSPLAARWSIVGAALLWSTGGAAIKSTELGALQIAGGRALFAGLAVFILFPSSRQRFTKAVWLTAGAYAAVTTLFVVANRYTTAANAIFLQNIAPIWVLLFGVRWLGERPTRAELWSVPVALLGSALFLAEGFGAGRIRGDLAALLASIAYATLIVRYRSMSPAEGLTATVLGNIIVFGLTLPALYPLVSAHPSGSDLAALLYLGVVQQAVAAFLFVRGVNHTSALEASLLILLEPLLAPVFAFLLVGEGIGPTAMAGAALVLAATVGRTLATLRRS